MHGAPVIFWRDGENIRATEDMPGAPRRRRRQSGLTHGTPEYITQQADSYTHLIDVLRVAHGVAAGAHCREHERHPPTLGTRHRPDQSPRRP
jgi:hypothetical protein